MSTVLEVEGVSKHFGGLKAVQDVSFSVRQGEIFSVIGPNGAGKTTLFNVISAVLKASAGRVVFGGRELTRCRTSDLAKLGVSRTFQNLALFHTEPTVANVLTGLHHQLTGTVLEAAFYRGRLRRQEIEARQRVEDVLAFLRLEDVRDAPVGTLAYGLQKRVELARAMVSSPQLLLLDEMVSGMNQEEREDIARFVLDLRDEMGVTVLMIEHDMGVVMDISDRVAVMHQGRLIACDNPEAISGNSDVIEAYLGRKRGA
ncbi:ABC transporter ATP-binding protein [Marinibacterium sp. SX1]|uniref:ABC transporter ATP-binding protein n=1 Tax=Marinibacterium sp. SX1 TaxID=3388424 RepID=UPI003D17ED37